METLTLSAYRLVNQDVNVRINPAQPQETTLQYAAFTENASVEYVYISDEGRQLAQGDVVDSPARYYFSSQIENGLSAALNDQPEQVSQAIYRLIDDKIVNAAESNDEQRQLALELGLSQASYFAEQYLSGDKKAAFMESINLLASVVKTRQVGDDGSVSYLSLPERVPGTNEYKVDVSALMKEKDPERYQAYLSALESGGDWSTPYLDFVKQFPQHPDWISEYQTNADRVFQSIADEPVTTRFAQADMSSSVAWINDVRETLRVSSDEHTVQTHIQALKQFVDVLEGASR
ncbi:hypothetical protein [Dickeya oryzae]|uniref:hypothetical protein n=1 Tax=Dickeya oryzae TaxID=1240404 RepID=UPI0003A3D56E|nr:hypothetical protein [Dickeya oryzae]